MLGNPNDVIVMTEDYPQSCHHVVYAHHRQFPEVRGEGDSPEAAADHLVERLSLTLDHAPSHWRQGGVDQAIEDVRAFAQKARESTARQSLVDGRSSVSS